MVQININHEREHYLNVLFSIKDAFVYKVK